MGNSLPRYCTTTVQQTLLSACCTSTLPVSQLHLNQFAEIQSESELWHRFIIVLLWQIKKKRNMNKEVWCIESAVGNMLCHGTPAWKCTLTSQTWGLWSCKKQVDVSKIITQHFLTVVQTSRLQLVSIHFTFTRWRHDAENEPLIHNNGLVSESRLKAESSTLTQAIPLKCRPRFNVTEFHKLIVNVFALGNQSLQDVPGSDVTEMLTSSQKSKQMLLLMLCTVLFVCTMEMCQGQKQPKWEKVLIPPQTLFSFISCYCVLCIDRQHINISFSAPWCCVGLN